MSMKEQHFDIFRGVIRLHNSASWYTLHKQLGFASCFITLFNSALHREINTGITTASHYTIIRYVSYIVSYTYTVIL